MADAGSIDTAQLFKSIEWSLKELTVPREKRRAAIKEYVGKHYAAGGADRVTPINLLELAATIYVRTLAARAPAVMVTTGVDELKPFAESMQIALNQVPDEIDLGGTMRSAVYEALFGMGVVKVALAASGQTIGGHDPGEPFVDNVLFDDYFCDMSAKSRKQIQYEGNDYWLDLEDAKALADGSADKILADDHTVSGPQGEDRAESISTSTGADQFAERILLRDVWLPREKKLLTYAVKLKKLLRVVSWDGPESGPYHALFFAEVPGNLLPLPPVALWIDLHILANKLFRKLADQGESKKSLLLFAGGNDKDVEALKAAEDGDGIRYGGSKPESVTVGGIDAETMALFLQSKDLFSYIGGNLDALGGLSPQTETVGQDKLLADAAGARTDSMRAMTIAFVKKIFRAIAWYEWTDPLRKRTIEKDTPHMPGRVVRSEWSDETREGNFLDFNLEINPHSMQDDTPETRLNKLGMILERFIFPSIPLMEQQGVSLDIRAMVETVAKLSNLDELRTMIIVAEPIQGDPAQASSEQPSFKPAHTSRTVTRVNRPGATRAGKDDALTRILMGGTLQPAEAAQIGRPVS